MKCAYVLDGNQSPDLNKYIIILPGGDSPEKVIMNYAQMIYDNDSPFWTNPIILELNYGKARFRDNVKPDIDDIATQLHTIREDGNRTHGKERELRKKVFLKHELLFKQWVIDEENADSVSKFYKNLNIIYKKVAEFHGINPQMWTV